MLDTLWFLMLAETIELSRPRLGNTISEAVKDGSIAYFLNKPYDFLLYHYSTSMGETIFRAILNALFGGAVVWWLVGPPPAVWGWPLAAVAVLGAWTLNFCISAMIGLAAFAVEDVSAFNWIYQKFAFIFGGLLIPLDFYPAWLRTITNLPPEHYLKVLANTSCAVGNSSSFVRDAGYFGTPVVLVVEPTRELAKQVESELAWLYAPLGARAEILLTARDLIIRPVRPAGCQENPPSSERSTPCPCVPA